MEHCKCDLCGKDSFKAVWDKNNHTPKSVVIRDKQGNILNGRNVICRNCGLVYVNPRMSREELDIFYRDDYRKVYGLNKEKEAEAELRHAHTAGQIIDGLINKGILLDVGCSTGKLIELFPSAYGIEPNKEHYEIAKTKGLNVENCSIEGYAPGMKFDIITMLNALEHVYSPTETLNKIHSLLNDDGYLLISVPNIYNRSIHIPVDAFLSNAHLYNFSIDTITQYFLKCGFKIVNQYQVVEEMGEKIYLLGQRIDQKQSYVPTIGLEVVNGTIEHLQAADFVWYAKYKISKMGFK